LCGSFWLVGLVHARWAAIGRRADAESDFQLDLFLAARGEYLRGEWNKATDLLQQLLRRDPRDAEARLMLATLMRHEGEIEEAREHLRKLQRLERAGHWNEEIQREWQQLTWQSVTQEEGLAEQLDSDAADDRRSDAA
jgi:tetratricopeptide (TPR) repeat protein